VHLFEDATRRPAEPPSRTPSDVPPPEPDKPGAPADFDLERALWDMEYRRQVLEILRRNRRKEAEPPAAPTPRTPDCDKMGP
jgi:hypothetical protein